MHRIKEEKLSTQENHSMIKRRKPETRRMSFLAAPENAQSSRAESLTGMVKTEEESRRWLSLAFLLLASVWIPGALVVCTPANLEVSDIEFCTDYDVEGGNCSMQPFRVTHSEQLLADLGAISVIVREGKQLTWKDWNYHIYFDQPVTVGLFLKWNREASLQERADLRKDLHCIYSLNHPATGVSVRGELEGMRLEKEGLWCFDYLGTLLGELQKQEKTLQQKPDPSYFPVRLGLEVESSKKHLRRELTRNIVVTWR
ncbi:MAG: hypothetical protein KDK23_10605 [Leptospiraceae bacterium]|nr:hypothetical protein [Leptospiraceae bacterium]